MVPLMGACLGGGASSLLGSAFSSGFLNGLLGSFVNGSSGGLFAALNTLFSGNQQTGGNQHTNELLGDIKEMLGQLLDQKSMIEDCGDCQRPTPELLGNSCGAKPESECGSKPDDCDAANKVAWDGENNSPSLDREHGAARLLEQAKDTHDPKEKCELIQIALELLQKDEDNCCCDGNSYNKDIVEHAKTMLEKIDDSCLSDCGRNKAMDRVIDLLADQGGVDMKPADNGCHEHDNGLAYGWRDHTDHDFWGARPLPTFHSH